MDKPSFLNYPQPSPAPQLPITASPHFSFSHPHLEGSGWIPREPKMGGQKVKRRRWGSRVTPCSHLILLANRVPLLALPRSTPHSQMVTSKNSTSVEESYAVFAFPSYLAPELVFPKSSEGFLQMPSSIFHVPNLFSPFKVKSRSREFLAFCPPDMPSHWVPSSEEPRSLRPALGPTRVPPHPPPFSTWADGFLEAAFWKPRLCCTLLPFPWRPDPRHSPGEPGPRAGPSPRAGWPPRQISEPCSS